MIEVICLAVVDYINWTEENIRYGGVELEQANDELIFHNFKIKGVSIMEVSGGQMVFGLLVGITLLITLILKTKIHTFYH